MPFFRTHPLLSLLVVRESYFLLSLEDVADEPSSRKVGLGTTVEYIERKFKTKAKERHVAKNPWRSPGSNLRHQIA